MKTKQRVQPTVHRFCVRFLNRFSIRDGAISIFVFFFEGKEGLQSLCEGGRNMRPWVDFFCTCSRTQNTVTRTECSGANTKRQKTKHSKNQTHTRVVGKEREVFFA